MNLPTIRFNGNILPHNPHTLKIVYNRNIKNTDIPYIGELSNDYGPRARIVTGKGELYGKQLSESLMKITAMHESGTAGILSMPDVPPFTAILKELTVIREPKSEVIGYTFTFVEQINVSDSLKPKNKTSIITHRNTNLWEIAALHNAAIEDLVEKNYNIETPYTTILPGKEVFI